MTLTIKFIGALRNLSGKTKLTLKSVDENFSVKDLILKLLEEIPQLKSSLINQQTDDNMKTNALILVNDREISVLNGVDTKLHDGDEVVFVPVVHGG